jgi:hypothetical protein
MIKYGYIPYIVPPLKTLIISQYRTHSGGFSIEANPLKTLYFNALYNYLK